jgi:hypothetical protein
LLEFAHECAVPVRPERMAITETVAGQLLAKHDCNLGARGVQALGLGL